MQAEWERVKCLIHELSRLRNEFATNKPLPALSAFVLAADAPLPSAAPAPVARTDLALWQRAHELTCERLSSAPLDSSLQPHVVVFEPPRRHERERDGGSAEPQPSSFSAPWLYVECYLYRRIVHAADLMCAFHCANC